MPDDRADPPGVEKLRHFELLLRMRDEQGSWSSRPSSSRRPSAST